MKLLIASISLIFVSLLVSAHPNPQYRVCNERGGEFVVVYVPFDQVGLCKIGASYVGSLDSMNYFYESKLDLSISNYKDGVVSCPDYFQTVSLEGVSVELCRYEDGSMMDYQSVMNSKYSPSNSALNIFLQIFE